MIPTGPSGGLKTQYQQYMHLSKYSRWRDDLGRRETWDETVDRYFDFWERRLGELPERDRLREALFNLGAVPSMRCLMTAGPALEKDECAGYNCTFLAIRRPQAWDEAMYLLMCGVGVGYSVETRYVEQLPTVPSELVEVDETIVVGDSKYGWALALRQLIFSLYQGKILKWDTSEVRPSGAILKTFGGRASGPEPLVALFLHVVEVFERAKGRKLTSNECHSVCCKIGDIVVVGGVRRSAMISLFSTEDEPMRRAKMGDWFKSSPHLGMANNSAVYERRPTVEQFTSDMEALIESQAGEPGFFNREAARAQAARWGKRDADYAYGVNPCGEIILRDMQMCNLSEVIARPGDTEAELIEKIEVATIFGTLQSTLTNFVYLEEAWSENCREERLLGVSIAGIPDHPLLNGDLGKPALTKFLERARERAWAVNAAWADRLGIPRSSAITCLKPSGNTSQLTNSSSPLKPAHADYWIRRTRGSKNDPVSQLMIDQGVPHEDEAWHPDTTVVFEWPQRKADGAKTRHDWDALKQLDLWLTYREHWCDHNPSCTVNVKSDEWDVVSEWVWNNWDYMTGITFLPGDEHSYVQAPYEEIDEQAYNDLVKKHPSRIVWDVLSEYEREDLTESARELSCSAGSCEIV